MNPLFSFDRQYSEKIIVGIDEAGRGPLAGPVSAAAVVLDYGRMEELAGINDSKKISPKKREDLYRVIQSVAVDKKTVMVDHYNIDEINILQASLLAMKKAVEGLETEWDILLVDGNRKIPGIPEEKQVTVVKGDSTSACIAAASILAKVERDRFMEEIDRNYPEYEFAKHKGYPTARHIKKIKEHGICPFHRKTFCSKFVK